MARIELGAVQIDTDKRLDAVRSRALGYVAAKSFESLSRKYIPMRTGTLESSGHVQPWRITYPIRYAEYMYYGTKYKYRKDRHPMASRRWAKAAETMEKPRLIRAMQACVDSGAAGVSK